MFFERVWGGDCRTVNNGHPSRPRRATKTALSPFSVFLKCSHCFRIGWKRCPQVPVVVAMLRLSVLAAVDLKRHQEVLWAIGESRLTWPVTAARMFFFFFPRIVCFFFLVLDTVTVFLFSNDSLSSSASDTFHFIPPSSLWFLCLSRRALCPETEVQGH